MSRTTQVLVEASEVDVVVSAAIGGGRPLISGKRHEPAGLVMLSLCLLLDFVGVGSDSRIVALKTCEVDARHVPGILEEVAYLKRVDYLTAMRIAPVESVLRRIFSCDDRVAGTFETCILVYCCQSMLARFRDAASINPYDTSTFFVELHFIFAGDRCLPR